MKIASQAQVHQIDTEVGSSVRAATTGAELATAVRQWGPGPVTAVAAVAALLALATALLLGGGSPQPVLDGLPDAGVFTGWGLPVTRVAFDVAAIGSIGYLLLAAVLVGGVAGLDPTQGRLSPLALRATRKASWWAAGWCAATLAQLALSMSDIVGVPVTGILSLAELRNLLWTVPIARALVVTLFACLALAVLARRTATRAGAGGLLLVAVGSLVPVLFTGHAVAATDHDLATSSLVVHVVAAALWVGGLLALLVCVRGDDRLALATALPRFSALALGCFVVVGFSGVLSAFVRLGSEAGTWLSPYGALLVTKAAALALLGGLGAMHRRRSIPAVLSGRPRAFLRLAAGEVVIMAAVVGAAVALGRTPVPAIAGTAPVPLHGAGHATLSWEVAPWSPVTLLTQWRPDAIVLTAVGIAAVAYLLAVRRLARLGHRWPARRTTSAMAGLATATLALCGGVASYSTALFSMQVAQLMIMATVVPILLTLGMPLNLALQSRQAPDSEAPDSEAPDSEAPDSEAFRGPRHVLVQEAAAVLGNPVNGLLLLVAVILGPYASQLFEMSLRYFTVHLLANVLALAGGLAFFWGVLCVDVLPKRRGVKERALLMTAFLLFLVAFGAALVGSDGLYGARWFAELGWSWADPAVDQRLGGAVVWAFALGLAPVTLLILLSQQRRSGNRRPSTKSKNQVKDGSRSPQDFRKVAVVTLADPARLPGATHSKE